MMMMSSGSSQLVKVRREILEACMTCPLCNKLLKEATTISECLHTFCRKCIYKKLTDEEFEFCPICNIDLGCVPVEKLRQDHNLQDVRSKVFPFKRKKVKASESMPSVSLPVRRKERSLSSLVVSTPRVSTQSVLTGRRTKSVARKAATLKGASFSVEELVKKEEDPVEDHTEGSSSPETLTKIAQNKRQSSSTAEPSKHHVPNKDTETGAEPWEGKSDLWKPLDCLVEAANRTKSFKYNSFNSPVIFPKSEPSHEPIEANVPKTRVREHTRKSKVQDDKNGTTPLGVVKPRKLHGMGRRKASASWELGKSAQAILDAAGGKRDRGIIPIWFTLVASEDQEGDAALPQISACYLRIKDGNVPVSFIQKYLARKLDLVSEAEVEIMCRGQPVVPSLQLHNLVDLWLQTGPITERVPASVGTSAKDFVMVLVYARKVRPS